MHVWIVATYEPLPTVDIESRLLRCGLLAQVLRAQGHTVTWWTSAFNHVQRRNRVRVSTTIDVDAGYRIRMLWAPEYRRSISLQRVRHNRAVATAFQLESTASRESPAVIFAAVPSLELAEQAVSVGRARGIPVVVDARDPWPDLYLTAFPRAVRAIARLALASEFRRARRIFSGATGVTAVSEEYLRWALGYAGRQRTALDGVFPIGYPMGDGAPTAIDQVMVDALRQRVSVGRDDMVVSFAGMFGASYDLETAVAAGRLLQETAGHRIRIIIAGDGDRAPQLRHAARTCATVSLPGWLHQAELAALLQVSDVGLAAYSSRARQSLPNKPFEYMAAGVPVVSSLAGELAVLLDKHEVGCQYRAGDAKSLADVLLWLSRHPAERKAMGARARALVWSEYRSEVILERLIAHLLTVSLEHEGVSTGSRRK